MFNEIFRLSGAHDLKLETDEMDQEQELANVGNDQFLSQIKEQWPQVLEAVQMLVQQTQQAQRPQPLQEGEVAPGASAPPQAQPEQMAQPAPDQQVQV